MALVFGGNQGGVKCSREHLQNKKQLTTLFLSRMRSETWQREKSWLIPNLV